MEKRTLICIFAILFSICFLSACSSESSNEKTVDDGTTITTQTSTTKATTSATEPTKESYDYGSMNNPHDITADDIPNVKVGEYIRITAPARTMNTSKGRFLVGVNEELGYSGNKSGLELIAYTSDGENYYTIEAMSIDPGDFREVFSSHPGADFSLEPRKIGDRSYSGCKATVIGCVSERLITQEYNHFYGIELGWDSVVEDLELYY